MKNNSTIICGILSAALIVSGLCTIKKEDNCEVYDGLHVHEYIDYHNTFEIKKWDSREKNSILPGFQKTDNYLPATEFDLKMFDYLSKNSLFDGRDNLEYLNYLIGKNIDYLEYYYHYTQTETRYRTVTHTNSDGETYTEIEPYQVTETYEGWTDDYTDRGVTGKLRVVHTKYIGYKLCYDDKDIYLIKSEPVDDIRSIIMDYPYIRENCYYEVNQEFKYSEHELPHIKLEDIDPFFTPTVENNPLDNIEQPKKIILK